MVTVWLCSVLPEEIARPAQPMPAPAQMPRFMNYSLSPAHGPVPPNSSFSHLTSPSHPGPSPRDPATSRQSTDLQLSNTEGKLPLRLRPRCGQPQSLQPGDQRCLEARRGPRRGRGHRKAKGALALARPRLQLLLQPAPELGPRAPESRAEQSGAERSEAKPGPSPKLLNLLLEIRALRAPREPGTRGRLGLAHACAFSNLPTLLLFLAVLRPLSRPQEPTDSLSELLGDQALAMAISKRCLFAAHNSC